MNQRNGDGISLFRRYFKAVQMAECLQPTDCPCEVSIAVNIAEGTKRKPRLLAGEIVEFASCSPGQKVQRIALIESENLCARVWRRGSSRP